jgi:hypothetical protein
MSKSRHAIILATCCCLITMTVSVIADRAAFRSVSSDEANEIKGGGCQMYKSTAVDCQSVECATQGDGPCASGSLLEAGNEESRRNVEKRWTICSRCGLKCADIEVSLANSCN